MPYSFNPLPWKFDKTSTAASTGGITQITVNSGGVPVVVTPTAGNINYNAGQTNTNVDEGIRVTGSGSTVTYELTNRNTGTVSTVDDTPTTLLSVALGAGDGTYYAEGNLIAYNVTDGSSAAYAYFGAARSTAGVATELAIEQKSAWEEASMADCDFSISVSGNNLVVTVVGIPAKNINWDGYFIYRYVGA